MYPMTIIADNPTQARNPLVWGLVAVSGVLAVGFVRYVRRTENRVMIPLARAQSVPGGQPVQLPLWRGPLGSIHSFRTTRWSSMG